MTAEKLREIARVIVDEHAEDIGKWMKEIHFTSPLYILLNSYHDAAFRVLRDIRMWNDSGVLPQKDQALADELNRAQIERIARDQPKLKELYNESKRIRATRSIADPTRPGTSARIDDSN